MREAYQERQRAEAPNAEEQQAEQAATDFYTALGKDKADTDTAEIDSTSFCDLMSSEAQAQTIHYAEASSGVKKEWDCESAVELLVIRSKRAGGFEGIEQAKVIGVNAVGNKATATVRFGDSPLASLPLVKEDGKWKLAANSVRSVR